MFKISKNIKKAGKKEGVFIADAKQCICTIFVKLCKQCSLISCINGQTDNVTKAIFGWIVDGPY